MSKRKKQKRGGIRGYIRQAKSDMFTFTVYVIVRTFVVAALLLSCINGKYENLYFCTLALILLLIPTFVEQNFGIELPRVLETIIILFIFASTILGEIGSYYTRFPYWDTMLHTVNGFLCAAIGFALTDILNRNEKIKFELSPVFLAIVAFCFSMTIGILWEFFEFGCDIIFKTDMQKDSVVNVISSVLLGENARNPKIIESITTTTVNGKMLDVTGYLDIGLFDTMKDLAVNFIGAVVFSIIGYFYVKNRGKGRFAGQFIPIIKKEEAKENK